MMYKHISALGLLIFALSGCMETEPAPGSQTAQLSAPVQESGTVTRNEWHNYGPYEVASGTLTALLTMSNGDADLYVSVGRVPSYNDYDCRPYLGGNRTETCEFDGPVTVYVAVAGYGWRTDYQLDVTSTGGAPECGDAVVDPGELCDQGTISCSDLDGTLWIDGTATCADDCQSYVTNACVAVPVCGNDEVEGDELCDQAAPIACTDLSSVYESGDAYCDGCTGWDESACVSPVGVCGNATLDAGEVCDGKPIACRDLDPAWRFGDADCLSDCTGWDASACNQKHQETESNWGTIRQGMWRHYVPVNATDGEIVALMGNTDLGGTGDADLYIRRDRPATSSQYDCRSNGAESVESCTVQGPGLFYVSVYGYAPTSDYTLEVSYWFRFSLSLPNVNRGAGNVSADEWVYFGPYHPDTGIVQFTLSGTNDADLYVKRGSQPTANSYDCRPYASNSDEFCELDSTRLEEFYVGVRGYSNTSYFELLSVNVPDESNR